jgi:hypothetical protein
MHPNPLVKLSLEPTHQCPCGAVPEYPHGMCCKCYAGMVWRRRKNGPARRASRRRRGRQSRERGRILALAESMSSMHRKAVDY